MTTVSLINKIGNTPLIYLKKASEISGCKIFGKAEFLNPGESVKDRAALYILNDAIKNGKLKKGGTIVEGTAGNTGIGIALIAKELGISYRFMCYQANMHGLSKDIEKMRAIRNELKANEEKKYEYNCPKFGEKQKRNKQTLKKEYDSLFDELAKVSLTGSRSHEIIKRINEIENCF